MTKTKFIVSAVAAAAAVMAARFMKNRGKIKVEGEIKSNPGGLGGPSKKVHGSATVGVDPQP